MSATISIRRVENVDSAQVIALVARCFADYPGCVLDVDGEEPGLRAPADHFESMWVAELDQHIVGMIAGKLGDSADGWQFHLGSPTPVHRLAVALRSPSLRVRASFADPLRT